MKQISAMDNGENSKDYAKMRAIYIIDGWLYNIIPDGKFEHLDEFGAIILDEIHERSLSQDLMLALISKIMRYRDEKGLPIHIILSSATLHKGLLLGLFGLEDMDFMDLPLGQKNEFQLEWRFEDRIGHNTREAVISKANEIFSKEPGAGILASCWVAAISRPL
jgi:HrpA-like RNA helicase